MLNPINAPTATAMHDGMVKKLFLGTKWGTDYDHSAGSEVSLHNVMIGVKSFAWEYDLKQLWMAKSRWNTMVRQYLEPDAVEDWFAKIEDRLVGKGRGIAVLRTRLVQGKGTGRGVRRRWGSCMLSVSYRTNPVPTITLHSRTTYFGYLAAMDITVVHTLARYIASMVGVAPEEMNFVWILDQAQFHGFRSLAWPLMRDGIRAEMDEDLPNRLAFDPKPNVKRGTVDVAGGYRKALDGYARIVASDAKGTLYGDESFSSFARVRRRFHTEAFGEQYGMQFAGGTRNKGGHHPFKPLPSLHTSTLDLSPIGFEGLEK